MVGLILRVACVCIVLAGAETIHGIARMTILVPRVGVKAAQTISIVTGSLLAFLICLLLVPSTGVQGAKNLLLLGLVFSAFMASFDLAIGRYVARRPWSLVWADFDPRQGNLLVLGLALLTVAPLIVSWVRPSS